MYIHSFIQHHLSLGIKHIVFLDNNSDDRTVDIAKRYNNVTILQTSCPYSKYETIMKRYLVYRFSKNRWNLFLDIDELFDYPFSDIMSLNDLIGYLNTYSYDAVVAQMLDLFSDKKLLENKSTINDSLKEKYRYYDINSIEKVEFKWGRLSNNNVKMHLGGIRRQLFNTDNWLTKTPLVYIKKSNMPFFDIHQVSESALVADFTIVLLHFPFTSNFIDKVKEAVETNRYALSASHEYEKYWHKLAQDPGLRIHSETACKLKKTDQLIDNGFIVISNKFRNWVESLHHVQTFD